jgi:hypothetical protein
MVCSNKDKKKKEKRGCKLDKTALKYTHTLTHTNWSLK